MASGQTFYPPPVPVLFSNIYGWAKEIVNYLRAVRPIAGGNMRITQTKSGSIFSAENMNAPVGSIQPTFMDIYGTQTASADGRYTTFIKRLKDDGWLPCDGASYAVADYPALAYALGVDMGDASFNVPDLRGRMLMGSEQRSVFPQHSDSYEVGSTGGYRRHGQTENNHHDHVWTIDLDHTHSVPSPASTTICAELAEGDPPSCDIGSPISVPAYTASDGETGPPTYSPGVEEGFDAPGLGTVSRENAPLLDRVLIRAKHFGDDGDGTPATPGEGSELDDVDNRPPYIACNWIIRVR